MLKDNQTSRANFSQESTNSRFYALATTEEDRWNEVLKRCGAYDVYHLPGYHRLAEEQEAVRAVLCVLESGPTTIAMPLLLRRITGLPGIDFTNYQDATSVYGYPGPIANRKTLSAHDSSLFVQSLQSYFKKEGVITAFSRLHPILPNQELYLSDLNSQVLSVGPTIAIDLMQPEEVQRQCYRSNHRRDINQARRVGLDGIHDESWSYFDDFIEIYLETMRRTGATDYYFFDRSYFVRLRELLGEKLHLFVVLQDGVVTSGGLFTLCNSIIQYHLGGTDSRYLELAPSKLLFDTVRLWGVNVGATIFHLGGGLGSQQDSLFRFKSGFSNLQCQFKVWRMIVNPEVYEELTERRRIWSETNNLKAINDSYFPAYRCP